MNDLTSSRRLAEECSIRDLAIFSVVVYLRTWLTAPIAVDAPLNYFTVMGTLMVYPQFPHTTISASTSKGLRIYFWYQSEALLDLLLWTPEYPVTPKNLRLLPLKKYLLIHSFWRLI